MLNSSILLMATCGEALEAKAEQTGAACSLPDAAVPDLPGSNSES